MRPRVPLWAALVVLVPAGASQSHSLASAAAKLKVNTTQDELVQGDGRCSLREAIAAVNSPGRRTDCGVASRTSNTIVLAPRRYALSILPTGSDDNASGDLNLTAREPVMVTGARPSATFIDAARANDRAISVAAGARARMTRLTIARGSPGRGCTGGNGGGIYNGGWLVLSGVQVVGNKAGGAGSGGCPAGQGGQSGNGGGIYSRGKLTVAASTISGNRAADGASGGGIFSTVGRLRLVNSTLSGNAVSGGRGSAVAVVQAPSLLRNDTVAANGAGAGLFVAATRRVYGMRLQNTIVASSVGEGCVAIPASAIVNAGHNLAYGSPGCPGARGNPRLLPLRDYGGLTRTMALGTGSAAVGRIPRDHGHCPATDQRGVRRPEGKGCDIGAYEFAVPKITILAPFHASSFERGSRVRARFRCGEGGEASTIATCRGSVASGHRIQTGRLGRMRFRVTAIDKSGYRTRKTIHYVVWQYVNPVRRVQGLAPRRIDLGVDYGGSGPLLALGRGRVTMASNTDDGPESCWTVSCWPGGGIVVYRLLDGPFAGKYVYVAEHLRVTVHVGEVVRAGQQIAMLYSGYPWSEFGWAAGGGPEALADADGHRCACSDPGGWSSIEGRNMNDLLVRLGAPSGYLQSSVPSQSMPHGWPVWPRPRR